MIRVGVPRALDYYRYYPLVKGIAEALRIELVISPPSTLGVLQEGLARVVAESCLPLKLFCGHVLKLRDQVDFVIVPSVRSVEQGLYNCVKLLALPDVVRAAIPDSPPVLDFSIDVTLGASALKRQIDRLAKRLHVGSKEMQRAVRAGLEAQERFGELLAKGLTPDQAIHAMGGAEVSTLGCARHDGSPRLAVLGHPYLLYDAYATHNVLGKLGAMGVEVVTAEMLPGHRLDEGVRRIIGSSYWACEREITGAAGYFLHSRDVDGVLVVTVFGCGPDSMMINAVQRAFRRDGNLPLQVLTLDEHTAEAGLVTRLEAFVDTVGRARRPKSRPARKLHPATRPGSAPAPRILSFPRWGTTWVPISIVLNRLGVEYVVPPACSQRSLDLASKYSPEFVCIPYKLTLGNYLEALEMGANTLLQLSGPNNCRYGYYHKLQEQTLHDLGHQFQMLAPRIDGRTVKGIPETLKELQPGASWRDCVAAFWLGLSSMGQIDKLERRVQSIRARELKSGEADALWEKTLFDLSKAREGRAVREICSECGRLLDSISCSDSRDPLRVAIVGEIYVVQEPFINHDLERKLGKLGVQAHKSEQVSEWLVQAHKLVLHVLGYGHTARIRRAEAPYLEYWSGETIGQSVLAAEEGYDGVIHLAPFTCAPEIVAQNVLPKLRSNVDIPILTLVLDEQMGRAGLITRLEAFTDFLHRRKAARAHTSQIYR